MGEGRTASRLLLDLRTAYPSFFTILMSLRSTLVAVAGSMTFMTASTEMGAS